MHSPHDKPAPPKAGVVSRLAIEHHWPGVDEPERSPAETQTDSLNEPPKPGICRSRTAKRGDSSLVLPKRTKGGERGGAVGYAVRRAVPSLLPAFSSPFVSFGYQL